MAATTMGGEELWLVTEPATLRGADPGEAFAQVRDILLRRLAEVPDGCEVIAVEVALPGVVLRDHGQLEYAADLPWTNFPIREQIREVLTEAGISGIHVGVANDGRFAGLYATRSELRLPPSSVAVYIGGLSGIASGVIVNGNIFGGAYGVAGDLAHSNAARGETECWCGRHGCLTTVLGPEALLSRSGLMSLEDAHRAVADDAWACLEQLRSEAAAGNEQVLTALAEAGSALGGVIDDVLGLLNPHAAILGGYVGVLSPYLRSTMDARLSQRLSDPAFAATLVVSLEADEPRVVRGAATAARDACLADPLSLTRPISRA
ncbi:MAG: ROK family protein [Microlunatus sp.]|nr:ROK family protein [Microlunatus sp.]